MGQLSISNQNSDATLAQTILLDTLRTARDSALTGPYAQRKKYQFIEIILSEKDRISFPKIRSSQKREIFQSLKSQLHEATSVAIAAELSRTGHFEFFDLSWQGDPIRKNRFCIIEFRKGRPYQIRIESPTYKKEDGTPKAEEIITYCKGKIKRSTELTINELIECIKKTPTYSLRPEEVSFEIDHCHYKVRPPCTKYNATRYDLIFIDLLHKLRSFSIKGTVKDHGRFKFFGLDAELATFTGYPVSVKLIKRRIDKVNQLVPYSVKLYDQQNPDQIRSIFQLKPLKLLSLDMPLDKLLIEVEGIQKLRNDTGRPTDIELNGKLYHLNVYVGKYTTIEERMAWSQLQNEPFLKVITTLDANGQLNLFNKTLYRDVANPSALVEAELRFGKVTRTVVL